MVGGLVAVPPVPVGRERAKAMGVRIAVAAVSFSGLQALVLEQLRKHLRPGPSLVECATLTQSDAGAPQRLLALLGADPRPVALIGICLRPDPPTLAAF